MTLTTDPVLAAALTAAGTENNPFIAHLNRGTSATVSTGTGTEVSAAVNAVSGATYNFWAATPNGSNVARLNFAFGSAKNVSFVGLASHNLGSLGADVAVQYSTDGGSNWITSAAGTVSPADNRPIGFRFSLTSAADWRISVTGATGDVRIGVALLSKYLTIPKRIYQNYLPPLTPTDVDLLSNTSEGGHLMGTTAIFRSSRTRAAFSNVDPVFLRSDDWLAFQDAFNGGAGMFWHWRPAKYSGDLAYVWRDGASVVPVNGGYRDLMDFELQMRVHHEP